MRQGDGVFVCILQMAILRKESKYLFINALDEPLIDGDAHQSRDETLGHRGQVIRCVDIEIDALTPKLFIIIVPRVAAKGIFENEPAVLDDNQAVNVLINTVLNEIDGLINFLFVYPHFRISVQPFRDRLWRRRFLVGWYLHRSGGVDGEFYLYAFWRYGAVHIRLGLR